MKTIREETLGGALARLVQTKDDYAGILLTKGKSLPPIRGDDPEVVWAALVRLADQSSPNYFGPEGAIARFLSDFPDGFAGADYLATERNYKMQAVALAAEILPEARAADATHEDGAAAARVFSKTNLLSPFEASRIRDVLKSADGPAYLKGAANFSRGNFDQGINTMLSVIRPHGQPSWPMMTYLPFLWRPAEHMFLKPLVTVDFAERIGHRFARDYASGMTAEVYLSLLDLVAEARTILGALSPRDNVDVQSFIWVVGAAPIQATAVAPAQP